MGGFDELVGHRLLHPGQFDVQCGTEVEPAFRRRDDLTSAMTAESAIFIFRWAATALSAEWKHDAHPAANSCSGLVAPPGPPISFGIAREMSRTPSSLLA